MNEGQNPLVINFQLIDPVDIGSGCRNFVDAKPIDNISFRISFECDCGHVRSVKEFDGDVGKNQGNNRQPAVLLALGGNQAVNLRLQVGPRPLSQ
jgi:hypothetical protein